jgi:Flp pilus assembly protein TadG
VTDDRGSAALTALAVGLVVLSLVLPLVVAVAEVLLVADRARTAAEASALAALAGSALAGGRGEPDRGAAAEVAEANGGRLVEIEVDRWPTAVQVEVAVPLAGPAARIREEIGARAAARLVPPDDG